MEVPVRISDGRHPAPPRSPRRDHNRLLHRQEVAGPAIGDDRFAVPLIGDGLEPRGTVFKIQFVGKQHPEPYSISAQPILSLSMKPASLCP